MSTCVPRRSWHSSITWPTYSFGARRVAQLRVVVRLDREEAAEDHRLDLAVAGQRLGRPVRTRRERVAHAQLRDVLDARDHVPDLARLQAADRRHVGAGVADLVDVGL